ncbi:MAG: hypothetical protein ACRD3G_08730 [Vicinamibacterales bacterium]
MIIWIGELIGHLWWNHIGDSSERWRRPALASPSSLRESPALVDALPVPLTPGVAITVRWDRYKSVAVRPM